ncbi:MAG: MBL fold metallo-hydrolase [Terriglobia bacterium]|jgi:glyoxylase-like metal-dependent hydrolase (beta-lactamase superfamily II)
MELYPGVYRIQSLYGGRNLFQYLFVGDNAVLVDTGIAETPEKVIFPYMDGLNLKPQRLTLAVTTHADLDHQGGNDAIKRFAPGAWLSCGEADRELVEDPQTLFDRRYNYMLKDHDVGFSLDLLPQCGKRRRMDVTFSGGEKIRVRDDWALEVLHVPGHSQGHLALYDRKNKAAFAGDALHGHGCPKADGSMGIPVTYYSVDIYLSTLRYFENLAIDVLHTGHFPTMRGEEIRDFIADSRQTVELFDRVILRELGKHSEGLTLKNLIDAVADAVGDWPRDTWMLAMFPVKGHLDRLEQQGRIRPIAGSRPGKWQLA